MIKVLIEMVSGLLLGKAIKLQIYEGQVAKQEREWECHRWLLKVRIPAG